MRLFYDSEFTGLHKNTTLISIGLIAEDGNSFYAEFTDYDKSQVNEWIQKNVIDNLIMGVHPYEFAEYYRMGDSVKVIGDKAKIRKYLSQWLSQFFFVEIWSDVLAYDWILFQDIFGGAFEMPKNIYYIPFDLATAFKENDIDPDINREMFAHDLLKNETPKKHNALWDAQVIKACWEQLQLHKQANNRIIRTKTLQSGETPC